MRTQYEVITWLRNKGLLNQVYHNIQFYSTTSKQFLVLVNAKKRLFFWGAFSWGYSPEGHEFWKEVNDEFERWYIHEK